MGKVKVATLGNEEEEQLREKQRVRREEKKKREAAEKVHISGMKGGERLKSVGAQSEEEIDKMAKLAREAEKIEKEGVKVESKGENAKRKERRSRSKRYKEVLMKVDHNKQYPLDEAIKLLREVSLSKFDPTVELHINTIEKGLRGSVTFPHGTGKEVKVEIADQTTIDKIVEEVEKGKIAFDVLVAHPSVMPKLARVAKFLGPKGLMPNPKAGTISPTPEKIAEKFKGGEVHWKTESEFPIIHQRIGKLSFKDKDLEENMSTFFKSVNPLKIRSVTLKSTMSPGIKVQFS